MKLTLISQYAFYPMHWEAFRLLCTNHGLSGSVIAPQSLDMPLVHRQLGWVSVEEARRESFGPDIRLLPRRGRLRQQLWLRRQFRDLRPDLIWVQEEPTNRLLLQTLQHYRSDWRPKIVCAIAENVFRVRWWRRWGNVRRWRRLDRLIAVASPSVDGIRRAGMPPHIPADTLVAGAQAPPEPLTAMPLPLPRTRGDFLVGFAGRICPEKGWHVLLDAIERLPYHFKVAFAGGGVQADELHRRLQSPSVRGRAVYVGLLAKSDLWSFYKAVDCLATPHLTFPHWKEQFGGVLADAMALGLPLVGSDSGAIPEVVGNAGLIVPENNAAELASALQRLQELPALARQLGDQGRRRFEQEFSIAAYARKIARALELNPQRELHVAAA